MVLCLALAFLLGATAEPLSASELNAQGYRLYREGAYARAVEAFEAAISRDPRHALAHYNLACTLGVLRKKGKTCEYDAVRERILEHLQIAVELDPGHRKKMRNDPDFDAVRDTVAYQRLCGLSLARPRDRLRILQAVTWYGPAQGAYGPMQGARFHRDGTVSWWFLELVDDGVRRHALKGKYRLEGRRLRLEFEDQRSLEGRMTDNGSIDFGERHLPLVDDPGECDA